jgi:hypothetical protein
MRNAALLLLLAGPASAAASFVQEPGVRITSGVLGGFAPAPASRYYLIHDSTSVYSFASANGETFTQAALDEGVRLTTYTVPRVDVSSITGLTVFSITGGFRMLYSAEGSTGTLFRIYSATSADGYAWANDTGTIVTGAVPVRSPSVVQLASGDHRLYYVQNGLIFTALSTNQGRNFSAAAQLLTNAADGVAAVKRTDNLIRLYFTSGTIVYSALSTNNLGSVFNVESGVRFSTPAALGNISNPFVARVTTETWRWRMYYNFGPASVSTQPVYSASVHAPEITAISPDIVLRKDDLRTFTITGEYLGNLDSLGAAAQPSVSVGGIAGGNETWSNDLSMTFEMNTLQPLGAYNVVVTNPNGQSATLTAGLLIDAAGGSLTTLDNVFRPLQGGRARIDATVYAPGRLTLRLYTIDGLPVATLFDGQVPEGTTSVFWNGQSAAGGTVASGLYIVHAVGPKLNMTNKIVVIK